MNFVLAVAVRRHSDVRRLAFVVLSALFCVVLSTESVSASDHADPIDPFSSESLDAGITDLFVFPVDADGTLPQPFEPADALSLAIPKHNDPRPRFDESNPNPAQSLVIILCVRRALSPRGKLNLAPFTYRVHIDYQTHFDQVQMDSPDDRSGQSDGEGRSAGYGGGHAHDMETQKRPTKHEAFLRYGGWIDNPEKITENVIIEYRLTDKAEFQRGYPRFLDAQLQPLRVWERAGAEVKSGVFDDPFIFPAFFGTNVVAMVLRVPLSVFDGKRDFLIWATSHEGHRQIDHVGRSLRTQNPRFELLNTLHPREHAQAILAEHNDPSLMRDVFLRFNFGNVFAYRTWDMNVPDVMCFSLNYPAGFPNGRLLTDDVAAMLAQYGDTLLYELSYQHQNGKWPRQTTNDKAFLKEFPYLAAAHKTGEEPKPLRLSTRNRWKLAGIVATVIAIFLLENWLVARWYHRRKTRRAYVI